MMMTDGNPSLSIAVPSMLSPSGGRFDFDDGGVYCGGWMDGKAHGHGVCTGPKNVGEYSGSWNFGFEMSGVYKWKNGAVYEGRWQNGKRHGVGVEYNGKWIYRGEWSQGFKGRYGVKASSNSAVKYEGTWANGLQDGYGSETYSDGGYYQGQMCRGLRHGYGVRKSAPYGDSQLNNPNKNGLHQFATAAGSSNQMLIHSNSLQSSQSVDLDDTSQPKPDDGFKPNIDRTLASKNGFVLVAKPLDVPMMGSSMLSSASSSSSHYRAAHDNISTNSGSRAGASRNQNQAGGARRSSLTNKLASAARIPGSTQTVSLLRGLRLRKQKSTSDLDANYQSHNGKSNSGSNNSPNVDIASLPFSLSPEELDITDPTTVETYTGEWKHDKRNGHGVCDRSDGLKYEGQWHNDTKHGYGVTTFKDGTKEEGKYKNNILIADSKVKRFFQLGGANIRQRIDDAVKIANQAQAVSLKKAEIADTRAATARDKSDQATTAALEADRDSQIAYAVAKQYSDSHISMMQQPAMLDSFANQSQINPNRPTFTTMNSSDGMLLAGAGQHQATSAFQMRRASNVPDFGRPPFGGNQYQAYPQNDMQNQQQHQDRLDLNQNTQQQPGQQLQNRQQQQQQYLGPIEPFNGRRGSFRGGSHGNSGDFAPSPAFFSHHQPQQQHHVAFQKQRTLDPFNDLFDHYKSSNLVPASAGRGRKPFSKQTSLDYSRMSSLPPNHHYQQHQQHLGDYESTANNNGDRLRRFRGSSLDRSDAEQQNFMRANGSQQQQHQSQLRAPPDFDGSAHGGADASVAGNNSMQQQLRHLVTSGELHNQQQVTGEPSNQQSTSSIRLDPTRMQPPPQSSASSVFGQTPSPAETQNSYQRPPSSTAAGTSVSQQQQQPANSHFYPASSSSSALFPAQMQQFGGPSQINYGQRMMQPAPQHLLAMQHQRDAQSLADEQLRYHHLNYYDPSPLDRTDYFNYDFAITTSLRQSQMPLRRTASLSRSHAVNTSGLTGGKPIGSAGGQNATGRLATSGFATSNLNSNSERRNRLTSNSQTFKLFDNPQATSNKIDSSHQQRLAAQKSTTKPSQASGSPCCGLLYRKNSLQVRYNPADMGGLMSREEVAALSHAQREQKRLEAELAERRAKRPILHIYLNIKEFLSERRLILSVLLINMMLFKLFADLIT